jgi:hypothetical protein
MTVPQPQRRSNADRNPLNWLLLIPIVVPLLTPLFNATEPRLFGFPLFYWLQLAFILLGVGTTTLLFQLGRRRVTGGLRSGANGERGSDDVA